MKHTHVNPRASNVSPPNQTIMEEPSQCVPRPSPYPSSGPSDTSFSLEVTPERAGGRARGRKPLRWSGPTTKGCASSKGTSTVAASEPSRHLVHCECHTVRLGQSIRLTTLDKYTHISTAEIIMKFIPTQPDTYRYGHNYVHIYHSGDIVSGKETSISPTLLSAPHLNSTTHLYHKLSNFKQPKKPPAQKTKSSSGGVASQARESRLPDGKEKAIDLHAQPTRRNLSTTKRAGSSSSSSVADLEDVASNRPLQVCSVCR